MTQLVIDVGNTSTAVGLWRDGRVSAVGHCDGGFAEAAAAARRLLGLHAVTQLAYASVVPRVDRRWRAFARAAKLKFVSVSIRNFPLQVDYPQPETIGADRLADAAGAVRRYGSPLIVLDFGTAFTAALITAGGVWRGGVIAPGFPLVRDYFYERTAQLPRLGTRFGRTPKLGRSTEEAMRFGAIVGYRGMVREIIGELKRNFGADLPLVATGGFAPRMAAELELDIRVDPTLTLYGVGLICAQES